MKTEEQLLNIIKNVIVNDTENAKIVTLNALELKNVEKLAAKHDLTHFIGVAADNHTLNIPKEQNTLIRNMMFTTAARMEQLNFEFLQICKTLQNFKIVYMPLKVAIIKQYYPQSWMRTSCDIDILVHENEAYKAAEILCKKNGYTVKSKNYHDYSLIKKSGIGTHLELHFNLKETYDNLDSILDKVWQYSFPKKDGGFEYCMKPEFFMFHQYAHAYYHFVSGGCGIRMVLDLFLLNKKFNFNSEEVEELLKKANILKFARQLKKLGEVWFCNEAADELTNLMQDYIFTGGVYGTEFNLVAMQQQKRGGKFKYAVSKFWLPFKTAKNNYPILNKCPAMYPLIQIKRWGNLIFCGGIKRSVRNLSVNRHISEEKSQNIKKMMEELDLL